MRDSGRCEEREGTFGLGFVIRIHIRGKPNT